MRLAILAACVGALTATSPAFAQNDLNPDSSGAVMSPNADGAAEARRMAHLSGLYHGHAMIGVPDRIYTGIRNFPGIDDETTWGITGGPPVVVLRSHHRTWRRYTREW